MRARQGRAETRRFGWVRRADRECQRTKYAGSGGTLPTRLLAAGGGRQGALEWRRGWGGGQHSRQRGSGRVRARSTEREEGEGRRKGTRLRAGGDGWLRNLDGERESVCVCVTATSVRRPVSSVHHGRVQVSVCTGSRASERPPTCEAVRTRTSQCEVETLSAMLLGGRMRDRGAGAGDAGGCGCVVSVTWWKRTASRDDAHGVDGAGCAVVQAKCCAVLCCGSGT